MGMKLRKQTQGHLILQVRPKKDWPSWWPRQTADGVNRPAWVTLYADPELEGGWALGDVATEVTVLPASENREGKRVDELIDLWLTDNEDDPTEWEFATAEVVPE